MAVKAEFSADTSSFVKEVGKADEALGRFGKNANTLQTQVKAFDSVLMQAGINIGPAAKAMDEITAASGKTIESLGAFNVVALAIATALAAWNIGRSIAEFLKLDEAIAHGTATLLGWGDVIAQTSSAQIDTINAAIKNGAAATISYSEAIKFNTEFHKKRLDVVKDTAAADEKVAAAWKELTSISSDYAATVAAMNPVHVEQIQHYLEMGVSQGVLATAFGVTASQIKAVEASMKAAADADKAWLEGMKAAAEEAALYASVLNSVLKNAIDATAEADKRAVAALTTKTDAIAASIQAEQAARNSLAQTTTDTDTLTTAWVKMNTALETLQRSKVGDIDISARQQVIYNEYTDTLLQEAKAQDAATLAVSQAPAAFNATAQATGRATQAAGVYMNQLQMLVSDPKLAAFFGTNAQGAVATTLYSGGQAGITPEMAAAMAAGQFISSAGVGAVHNTFNVNGTAQDVARTISAEIMRTMKSGGKMAGS